MREIKFRQPLIMEGKFLRWHYWGFIDGVFVGIDTGWNPPKEAEEISQQYIEHHDLKGKEIFAGDIVNVIYPNKGIVLAVFEWHDYAWQYKILFALDDSSDSRALANHPYPYYSRGFAGYGFEIIGNIYENPDLTP